MNKFQKFCMSTRHFLGKHAPEIATGIGVAGMVGTVVLAVKATPKAVELLEDKKNELEKDELSVVETIKTAWKPYLPAAVLGIASAGCIIGASAANAKRNAALMAAYKLSEGSLSLYRSKVLETVGDKKEKEIRDKVAQSKVEEAEKTNTQVFLTPNGDTLFVDAITMREFRSDLNTVKSVINELNKQLLSQDYIRLDDYYNGIGLQPTALTSSLGWNISDGLIEYDISTCMASNDEPAIYIDFLVRPRHRYDMFA